MAKVVNVPSTTTSNLDTFLKDVAKNFSEQEMKNVVNWTKDILHGEYTKLPEDGLAECFELLRQHDRVSETDTSAIEFYAEKFCKEEAMKVSISKKLDTFKGAQQNTASTAHFIGRNKDVCQILDKLRKRPQPSINNISICGINLHGEGGVGKTRLAEEVAKQLCEDRNCKSIVVNLKDIMEMKRVYFQMLWMLDQPVYQDSDSPDRICGSIENLKHDLLLVFDNTEDSLMKFPDFKNFLTNMIQHDKRRRLKILLTSRLMLDGVAQVSNYPVRPFAKDASKELLLQITGVDINIARVGEIAELCCNKPFPLKGIAAILKEKLADGEEVLAQIEMYINEDSCKRTNKTGGKAKQPREKQDDFKQRATELSKNDGAVLQEMISKLSEPHRDFLIKLSIFCRDFPLTVVQQMLGFSAKEALYHLNILISKGCVESKRKGGGEKLFDLHPLMQEFLKELKNTPKYQAVYQEAEVLFCHLFRDKLRKLVQSLDTNFIQVYSDFEMDRPNFEQLLELSPEKEFLTFLQDEKEFYLLPCLLEPLLSVQQREGLFRGLAETAVKEGYWSFAVHLKCWEALQVNQTQGGKKARNVLAKAESFLSKPPKKSSEQYEGAQSMYLYAKGKTYYRSSFSEAKHKDDYCRKALKSLQQSLELTERIYGRHTATARCLNEMGNCYNRLGDLETASSYYERAYEMRKKLSGSNDHYDMAVDLNQIAVVHEKTGVKLLKEKKIEEGKRELNKAIEFYQKALDLEIKLKVNGYNNTALFKRNMANAYLHLKEPEKAWEPALEAYEIRQRVLGTHPETVRSLFQLGNVKYWGDDYPAALEYFYKANRMEKSLPAGNHSTVRQLIKKRIKETEETLKDAPDCPLPDPSVPHSAGTNDRQNEEMSYADNQDRINIGQDRTNVGQDVVKSHAGNKDRTNVDQDAVNIQDRTDVDQDEVKSYAGNKDWTNVDQDAVNNQDRTDVDQDEVKSCAGNKDRTNVDQDAMNNQDRTDVDQYEVKSYASNKDRTNVDQDAVNNQDRTDVDQDEVKSYAGNKDRTDVCQDVVNSHAGNKDWTNVDQDAMNNRQDGADVDQDEVNSAAKRLERMKIRESKQMQEETNAFKVGVDGVTLLFCGCTVEIPSGTLAHENEILLSVVNIEPPPGICVTPILRCEPNGLQFHGDITITLPLNGSPVRNPDDSDLPTFELMCCSGEQWSCVEGQPMCSSGMTFKTSHFTDWVWIWKPVNWLMEKLWRRCISCALFERKEEEQKTELVVAVCDTNLENEMKTDIKECGFRMTHGFITVPVIWGHPLIVKTASSPSNSAKISPTERVFGPDSFKIKCKKQTNFEAHLNDPAVVSSAKAIFILDNGEEYPHDQLRATVRDMDTAGIKTATINEKDTKSAFDPGSGNREIVNVLLLCDEWGSGHGGLSTLNMQLAVHLAKLPSLKVHCNVSKCSEKERRDASNKGVSLSEAKPIPGNEDRFLPLHLLPNEMSSPDIVVGHGRKFGSAAYIIRQQVQTCRWVQFVHVDSEEMGKYKSNILALSENVAKDETELEQCKAADLIVAVGANLQEKYRDDLTRHEKRVEMIIPGLCEEFRTLPCPEPKDKTKFCVYVFARCSFEDFELKGYDIVANAVALLDNHFILHAVGTPEGQEDAVRQHFLDSTKIRNEQLNVHKYCKSRESLKDLFCKADVIAMPSRCEAFGMVGLEAISAGIPVLISRKSGLARALKELTIGEICIVESEDFQKWANKLKFLSEGEKSFRHEKASDVRKQYDETYRWDGEKGQCSKLAGWFAEIMQQ